MRAIQTDPAMQHFTLSGQWIPLRLLEPGNHWRFHSPRMRAHHIQACRPKGLRSLRRHRIGRPEAVPLPAGTYIGSTGPRGLHCLNKTVDVAMAG
jgi:hypothetical protein